MSLFAATVAPMRELDQCYTGKRQLQKVCGFCTFERTMWKVTKLHRGFTSDIHSYKKNICNILSPHYK
jgi:hypothetical protein